MKTKLDKTEKARRQYWRDGIYAVDVITPPHHLTKQQRRDLANAESVVVVTSAAEHFAQLFPTKTKLVRPEKKKYLKMRARKKHASL